MLWYETKLKVINDAHYLEMSPLEARIGKLERDLGKTVSSLLKAKKDKKAKASVVRRLQCQIQGEGGSTSCGIVEAKAEAKSALCTKFQARLARIASSLDFLIDICSRDLVLAVIEGGMSEFQLFQGEGALSLQAEESKLSTRKEELTSNEDDFDTICASLKSECVFPRFLLVLRNRVS